MLRHTPPSFPPITPPPSLYQQLQPITSSLAPLKSLANFSSLCLLQLLQNRIEFSVLQFFFLVTEKKLKKQGACACCSLSPLFTNSCVCAGSFFKICCIIYRFSLFIFGNWTSSESALNSRPVRIDGRWKIWPRLYTLPRTLFRFVCIKSL